MFRRIGVTLLVVGLSSGIAAESSAPSVDAQQLQPASTDTSSQTEKTEEREWQYVILPYIWFLDNELTIGTEDYLQSDSTPFFEALKDYDYGALLFFEAHKPPWALYFDALVVRLTGNSRSLGLPVSSDIRQVMVEGAVVRRVPFGWQSMDLLAGARYFRLRSDVKVRFIGRFDDIFSWVEPMVGMRHNMRLGERWRYDWRLDVGGFGLGSKLTWQANTSLHYDINDRYSVNVGYRHIDIDYEDGDDVYDSTMSGPIVGMSIKF